MGVAAWTAMGAISATEAAGRKEERGRRCGQGHGTVAEVVASVDVAARDGRGGCRGRRGRRDEGERSLPLWTRSSDTSAEDVASVRVAPLPVEGDVAADEFGGEGIEGRRCGRGHGTVAQVVAPVDVAAAGCIRGGGRCGRYPPLPIGGACQSAAKAPREERPRPAVPSRRARPFFTRLTRRSRPVFLQGFNSKGGLWKTFLRQENVPRKLS